MPELRKAYQSQPGGEGAKVATVWKVPQLRTVSADAPLQWNQFTCHLTVENWAKHGGFQYVDDFHLSFKFWKQQSLAGPKQPGCKWKWIAAQSKFVFGGWFCVPSLYLKPGENMTVAQKATAFVRARASLLLIDALNNPAAVDAVLMNTLHHALADATPA